MKKIFLGGVIVVSGLLLSACGPTNSAVNNKAVDADQANAGEVKSDGYSVDNVTKKDVQNVRAKIEEIRSEVSKVQLDQSLSKTEKTARIEALQLELKRITQEAMEK